MKVESVSTQNLQSFDIETEKLLGWFWTKMSSAYQGQWKRENGEFNPKGSEVGKWRRTLSALTPEQVKVGVKRCEGRVDKGWPPNRIEFTRLAKQVNHSCHRLYAAPKRIAKGTEEDRMAAGKKGFAEARKLIGA